MLIRNCLTLDCAFTFFNSMVLSHISYGITTWSQAHQSSVETIECLYNRALKVLDKKRIRYHHCHIQSKYKILSFVNFISLHLIKLIFKCLNDAASLPLCKIITRQQSTRLTRSAFKVNCNIPFCRTSFAQTAVSVKGAKLWNSLPDYLKCIPTLDIFKKTKTNCGSFRNSVVRIFSSCRLCLFCNFFFLAFILYSIIFLSISIFILVLHFIKKPLLFCIARVLYCMYCILLKKPF